MIDDEPTIKSDAQRKAWRWAKANPAEVTLTALAEAGGVKSTGTAAKWLAGWREELGDDLFRTKPAEARAAQTEQARQASAAAWAELREREIVNLGVTASRIRGRILELIPTVGGVWVDRGVDGTAAPVPMRGPGGREVKAMADAVAKLLETAELLDGRPTRHTRRSVPQDQWLPPAGHLDTAEGMTEPEKRAKVLDIRSRLLERHTADG